MSKYDIYLQENSKVLKNKLNISYLLASDLYRKAIADVNAL